MARKVVVGVVGSCDPKHVEQTVASTGVNRDRLRILTAEEETPEYKNSPITFVHVMENMAYLAEDEMMRGTGVISDFGGTAVPGINAEGGSLDAFVHPDVLAEIGETEIPERDADRYNEAIEDGRCVLLFACDDETCATAQAAFEKAGVADVHVF